MTTPREVVVVGASLAGLRAVETLRERGYDGRLTLIGAEPHEPYDRPPLSKQFLTGSFSRERVALRQDGCAALALDLRLGRRAVALDVRERQLTLDDGARVVYDGLVIATGATPRLLPGAAGIGGVHVLRTLDDAVALRAAFAHKPRVAVVGAGFIGLEVAASCRTIGLDVTVVEFAPVPLAHALGVDAGASVARMHGDHGVAFRLGVGVRALESDGSGHVTALSLSDGTRVPADLVVAGIGVVPETAWLEGSGVRLDQGVVCDATLATGVPGVVAAGDVARWPNARFGETMRIEHWSNAVEQGRAAAMRLLAGEGEAPPFAPVPYFWSDQYDVKLQFAGHRRAGDESRVVEGSLAERAYVVLYGREGRLTGVLACNRPQALARYRKRVAERAPFEPAG